MEDNGHRQRLKDKFFKNGRAALEDYELLELLLTFAIPRRDTKEIAKELLKEFGSIRNILATPQEELEKIKGIGDSAIILLYLLRDISSHISETTIKEKSKISSPKDLKEILENGLADLLKNELSDLKKEFFVTIALDARNHILDPKVLNVYKGTVDQAAVYPREIIEYAIKLKATRIIIAHNHPSGHAAPSPADVQVTKTIKEALKLINVDLLDHIIVAGDSFYSFQEHNQL